MLDIPEAPELDKLALIGGCLKLPLLVDAGRLAAEVAALPESPWRGNAGRVGVQGPAQAIFLRGHAPAQGDLPIADRDVFAVLPYVRDIITRLIPAPPQRCLLARLPAGAAIAPHIDRAPYFSKTVRIHVAVATHEQVWMMAGGLAYQMRAGEVWALNNSAVHAVWNAHATLPRTHLICDYLAGPALLRLLAEGRRDCGRVVPAVLQRFAAPPPGSASPPASAPPALRREPADSRSR
jgi:hypothetical protein